MVEFNKIQQLPGASPTGLYHAFEKKIHAPNQNSWIRPNVKWLPRSSHQIHDTGSRRHGGTFFPGGPRPCPDPHLFQSLSMQFVYLICVHINNQARIQEFIKGGCELRRRILKENCLLILVSTRVHIKTRQTCNCFSLLPFQEDCFLFFALFYSSHFKKKGGCKPP